MSKKVFWILVGAALLAVLLATACFPPGNLQSQKAGELYPDAFESFSESAANNGGAVVFAENQETGARGVLLTPKSQDTATVLWFSRYGDEPRREINVSAANLKAIDRLGEGFTVPAIRQTYELPGAPGWTDNVVGFGLAFGLGMLAMKPVDWVLARSTRAAVPLAAENGLRTRSAIPESEVVALVKGSDGGRLTSPQIRALEGRLSPATLNRLHQAENADETELLLRGNGLALAVRNLVDGQPRAIDLTFQQWGRLTFLMTMDEELQAARGGLAAFRGPTTSAQGSRWFFEFRPLGLRLGRETVRYGGTPAEAFVYWVPRSGVELRQMQQLAATTTSAAQRAEAAGARAVSAATKAGIAKDEAVLAVGRAEKAYAEAYEVAQAAGRSAQEAQKSARKAALSSFRSESFAADASRSANREDVVAEVGIASSNRREPLPWASTAKPGGVKTVGPMPVLPVPLRPKSAAVVNVPVDDIVGSGIGANGMYLLSSSK